ncbi:hypothetical protein TVAG_475450 [Trichomonas vaginalis G3]|uniref:Uncharacterized protein n=1 Tax=Trichomonas vaginalis (strain ATCC PRA-98 / G3) TaxID=412133 RepID=A2GKC8_TRIV3|nr:hypothetical protein TVAGG3_0202440 [Trichomonas vaginalis G3]EAX82390.1 hypothetical protein TVAG_475450 [Trichomonas vaginalis G3]KAI5550692.1 hypothetical protein TVAGG3_0202440 [Trichomonas vaginalis G3]|eukprot:XP_001295320.1 hypothetical protein [Trichomonas vaginalis G3]
MGFNDWYSNFGYSMGYFWVNYVKLPLKIPSFNILIFVIANVNCKHFRTLLFIPELLLLYHVDRMPEVVKLKSKRSLFYYFKTIGYVQGLYLTVNALANSYDEFLAIRESTFFVFPMLSLVTLGLVKYYGQSNNRSLDD